MKEDAYDSLGKRMKRYEAVSNSAMLIPDLPLYARIDGRHFSKLTKGLGYPFEGVEESKRWFGFVRLMRTVAQDLMCEFKCDIAETHSDEISLGWKNIKTAPFEGRYFKLVSNLASFATSSFLTHVFESKERFDISEKPEYSKPYFEIIERKPSFDCRVYQVPDLMELANCFVWRQNDCIRGAINQYAQQFFSHKQLEGKSQKERLEMCEKDEHFFDNESHWVKMCYFLLKNTALVDMPDEFKKFHPENKSGKIVRTTFVSPYVPELTKIKNKVEYLFESATPECFECLQ